MHVNVTIMLGPDDPVSALSADPPALAQAVLAAVGGDESKDACIVNVSGSGSAGTATLGTGKPDKPKGKSP